MCVCQEAALLGARAGTRQLLWKVARHHEHAPERILVLLLPACMLVCRTPSLCLQLLLARQSNLNPLSADLLSPAATPTENRLVEAT